jgi:general L-amino acid transport system permease protein
MTGAARKAPFRPLARLKRFGGARASWGGLAAQAVLLAVLAWLAYEMVANVRANLAAQGIASGFGFLSHSAGFAVSQALIPYDQTDSYLRVFLVGLVNTLVVSAIGIVFATIIGFAVGLGRLSPNWLLARLAGGYVELIRNLPLLYQILFWYLAVLGALPGPRQSLSPLPGVFLSNRGIVVPDPVPQASFAIVAAALLLGIAVALGFGVHARRALFRHGRVVTVWPYALAAVIGLPLAAAALFGAPLKLDVPELRGFNFAGGVRLLPEFAALTIALSTYTAAFIAEDVRSGVLAVSRGQWEAGESLGLSRGQLLRLIVVPQALRVTLPPLANQYLNLTKNSSLAVAIGYPELFSVFAGTALSQTGQAIEIIAITMAVYLVISLVTTTIMNIFNWRVARRGQA